MNNPEKKLKQIQGYLKRTRKELDKSLQSDSEYNTSTGNGVNCQEANSMFEEVEKEIGLILSWT